jgi:hypothetical protein
MAKALPKGEPKSLYFWPFLYSPLGCTFALSACRSQGLGAGRSKRAVLTHHTCFGYPLRLLFYGSTHPTSWVGSLSVKRGKKKSNFKKLFNLN